MSAIRLTSQITLFFFLLQCLVLQPSYALLLPPREASETAHRGVLQSLQVSPWSGTLSFNEKDIPGNDPIFPLEVTRAYSTDLAGSDGEFGPGWTWKYGVRLLFDQKQIVYQDESGNPFLFKTDAKGIFRCPDLASHTIIKKGASFIYTLPSGQEQVFDASGAITRITDLRNNSVKIERAKGRAALIAGSTGKWLKLAWSGDRVAGIEDSTGRKAAYRYDPHDRLVEAVRFDGTRVGYGYDDKNRVINITYADGRSAAITYDEVSGRVTNLKSGYMNVSYRSEGNKSTARYGDDEEWVFEKDASGNRRTITGPWGGVWEMTYENGRLISKSNPHGGTTKYVYYQNGLLKSFTNPMNQTSRYVYHQKWPLPVEIRHPAGEVERYSYDEKGSLAGFTDGTGRKATIAYYPNGLIKQYKGIEGTDIAFKYNESGLPTAITNSAGSTSQMAYDSRGNLQKHTEPSGVATEIRYTPADLPEHVLRGGIVQLTAEYDAARSLVGLHESGMASYKMAFDQSGNISNARTSGDMTATYKRDSFGNIIEADIPGRGPAGFTYRNGSLIQATDKSGGTWNYTYDGSGKLASHQDPSGKKIRFVHNAAGYVTEKIYSNGETTAYEYDHQGRVMEASSGKGKISIRYDAGGRPVSEQISGMPAVRAVYGKSGKDFVLHIGDTQVKYSHNADGKLVKTSVANGPAVSFSHDKTGNIEAMNYSNGVRTTYAYDKSGRIISIAHQKENRVLTGRYYDWSPSGQVSGIEYLPTGTRSTLLYDSDSRLVSMEGPGKISVSYLQGGLRNSVKEGGAEIAPYRYDESWRLAEAGKVRYSHDAAGNRTARKDDRGVTAYAYDTENSLIAVKLPDGKEIRYGYDAFGRRTSIEKNGSVERLVYFGSNIVATADASGNIRRVFVPTAALDFPLFARIENEWYAYHQDINASITAMTDSRGRIAFEAEYNAFGAPLKDFALANPFGFAGMWYEKDSGIYHCRAREYDPAVGAFFQPDPFPGEVARPDTQMAYAFAHNNPVTNRDPEGKVIPLIIGAAVIGLIVTGIIVYPFVKSMGQNKKATDQVASGDISDDALNKANSAKQNVNTTAKAAEEGGNMPADPEGAIITAIQNAPDAIKSAGKKIKDKWNNRNNPPAGTNTPPAQAPGNSDEAQEARRRAEEAEKKRAEAEQRKRDEAARKAAEQRAAEEAKTRAREEERIKAEEEKRRAEQEKIDAEQKAREEAARREEERQRAEADRLKAEKEARERAERLKKDEERIKREIAELDKLKRDGYMGSDIDTDRARKQRELDANRRQQQQQQQNIQGQGSGTGRGYNPLDDKNIKSKGPAKGDKVDIAKVDQIGRDFQQTGKGEKTDGRSPGQQNSSQVIQQPGTYTDGRGRDTSGTDKDQYPGSTGYPPPYPTDSRGQQGTDWTKWTGDRKPPVGTPGNQPKDENKPPPVSSTTPASGTTPATTKGIEVTVVGTAPPGKCIIVQGQLVPVQGYKENISGMTVTLTGPVNQSATSSGSGGFSFKEIPAGDYIISVTQWNYGMTKQNFTAPTGKSIKITLKGSCPYLYVWDGKSFVKENDIYSVARITPSEIIPAEGLVTAESDGLFLHRVSLESIPDKLRKERSYSDYFKIGNYAKPVDGNYLLKIVEQASEHSYTDFIELLALDHRQGTTAGITRNGKPFLYENLMPVGSLNDLNGKGYASGRGIALYNDEGMEIQLPPEAFSSGILAVNWQGFLDGQGEGHTAAQGRPKLSLQRMDPQGIWQTVDWVYPRDEMQQTFFLMDNRSAGWDKDGKIRLVATSCINDKYHRIESLLWGNTITDDMSVSSLPLVSALISSSEDVLNKVRSSDGESLHLGPGEEVSLIFKSSPLDEGLERTLIFVSEGYYVPVPMIHFAEN